MAELEEIQVMENTGVAAEVERLTDQAYADLMHPGTVFCYTCRAEVKVGECSHVSRCEDCGKLKQIGDFPFCPHGVPYWREADAKPFDPVLVYELEDGSHYYAGRNDDPPPIGHPRAKPIILDTLRKADQFVRATNAREQEQIDRRTEEKRNHADKVQRESRAQLKVELEKRGISARNIDAIIADRDGRGPDKNAIMQQFEATCAATGQPFNRDHFEKVFEQTQRNRRNPDYRGRPQASFGIEVFDLDASNRRPHRDERTGWKGRKG